MHHYGAHELLGWKIPHTMCTSTRSEVGVGVLGADLGEEGRLVAAVQPSSYPA